MSAYYSIHKALTQSLIDLNLGIIVAHENRDFDPSENTSYTTDSTGYIIGSTIINIVGGSGEIHKGDQLTFDGDANQYNVAVGTLSSGAITLSTGLLVALPAALTAISTDRQSFIDVTLLPGTTNVISKDTLDEELGIYQVSIYVKSGTSVKTAYEAADLIQSFYKHGVTLTSGTQKIFIDSTSRNGGRNLNGWFIVDLSINYIADLSR